MGLQWNLIGQMAMYGITLTGTIILSRLLSPSEFGLFGMLAVLSSLASLVVGMGLAHAIVQNQQLERKDLSSIFWMNFLLGLVMAVFFFLTADWIAQFYGQPELSEITQVFSLIFIIYGCSAVPLGILSKGLKFKQLVLSQLIASVMSYGISIAMALANYGVWSLVAQAITNHAIYIGFNIFFSGWVPQVVFQTAALSKIAKFTRNFLPSQLLDFFSHNFDMLLIGKYFGKADLGYYGRASALVQLPVNSLGIIFNKTFFSMFSALQEKPEALSASYLRAIKYLSLSLIPILVLTAVAAEQIVLLLFGKAWVEMAPFTSWLAISGIITSYNNFNDSAITSQGRTDLLLRINVVEKIILIVSIVVGLQFGIIGIVYAKIFSSLVTFIPKLAMLSYVLKISFRTWFYEQRWIFISIGICALAGFAVSGIVSHVLLNLILTSTAGLSAMFIFLLLMREKSLLDLDVLVRIFFVRNPR